MRINRIIGAVAIGTLLTWGMSAAVGNGIAGATTQPPPATISGLAVNYPTVGSLGGVVTVSATVANAANCELLNAPSGPISFNCSGGVVSQSVTLPESTKKRGTNYKITLVASGAGKTAKSKVSVLVNATSVLCNQVTAVTNLSGCNLTAANLSGANLFGASFVGTNLTGVNLTNANLQDANLSDADMANVNLLGANLAAANLHGVTSGGVAGAAALPVGWTVAYGYLIGPGTNLSDVNLTGANLAGADLPNANLSYTNLRNADLAAADLQGAVLSGAYLTGADLSGADLSGANLTATDLTDASLDGADTVDVIYFGTTCPDGTISDNDGNTCAGHGGGL